MFATEDNRSKTTTALAIVFLLAPILAGSALAMPDSEEPLTLVIRPGLLPDAPAAAGDFPVPTRNTFIWPADQKARLEEFDGGPRLDPYEDMALHAIIWDSTAPVVIINNKELRTGDTIDGIKVRGITRDSVVLATKKTRRTLRFPSSGIDFSTTPAEVE
ncbi:MAG: hypothetical protein P1P81_07120 [Desulfobulbales bacterium]|nr:hypothetical protein [Desulfobulbales bacterium]